MKNETRLKELQSLSADGNITSYPQKFISRIHPQGSLEFVPRVRPHGQSPELVHRVHPQILFLEFILRLHPQTSSPDFIPRLHPQSSSPEFGPSSVLGPGTCFKAYNLIQSQDAWLELKNECYKKLVKKFSLLTTDDQEHGAKAIRAQKLYPLLHKHY